MRKGELPELRSLLIDHRRGTGGELSFPQLFIKDIDNYRDILFSFINYAHPLHIYLILKVGNASLFRILRKLY